MHISLQGVTKTFGATRALDDVTAEISPGSIVAVVGANGAGKSTLLRLLSAVQIPTAGSICFDGEAFSRPRLDLRRRLMYLPDIPPIFPLSTPLAHLAMVYNLYEAERADLSEFVVRVLEELDLLPLAECTVSTLSRGQAYKAALATLLTVDPELWLLDEPFAAGMDPQGQAVFRRYASKAAGRGRTVFYTTQILEIAELFSDYVMIIDHGKLFAFDSVRAIVGPSAARSGVLEGVFARLRETKSAIAAGG
jgi:ABC-type multidrug transport system ATPase subunit